MTTKPYEDGRLLRRVHGRIMRVFLGAPRTTHLRCYGRDISIVHRGSDADYSVIRQCFITAEYEMPETPSGHGSLLEKYYTGLTEAGFTPLIVDCGANIGASALWFHRIYEKAHLVCIEPDPGNFRLLQTNCPGSAFTHFNCAIGGSDRMAQLVDPGQGEWAYRIDGGTGGVPIEVRSISTILQNVKSRKTSPLILKIYIEGAESELFSCYENDTFSSFPVIFLEPHDWLFGGQKTLRKFLDFHVAHERDLLLHGENLISFDYRRLARPVRAGGVPAA
jgi:FkbM family methyltransferase